MSTDKPSGSRKSGSSKPQDNERGDKPAPGGRKRFVRTKEGDERKPFKSDDKPKRNYEKRVEPRSSDSERPKRSYDKKENPRSADNDRDKRPYGTRPTGERSGNSDRNKRPYGTRPDGERPKGNAG